MQSRSRRSPPNSSELKQAHQIADRRPIGWDILVRRVDDRIWQVVAAPRRQRVEMPIRLDEFEDRNVVGIGVVDRAFLAEGRDGDQWDARAVAKCIEDLDITAVPIAAAFIDGDEDGGL